jgi:hypothetical protein
VESCSESLKYGLKFLMREIGKVNTCRFPGLSPQRFSSGNCAGAQEPTFHRAPAYFYGRWHRITLWETLQRLMKGLGYVPIWLWFGTFHSSKFPQCCCRVWALEVLSIIVSSTNESLKENKDSEFCLLSLQLCSLGNSSLCPPSCIPCILTDIHYSLNQHWQWEVIP